MKVEWKVRPVTRYIVTRFEEDSPEAKGQSTQHGEYDNAGIAHEVGYALCKAEHDRLGYPPGDERIKYPKPLDDQIPLPQARPGAEPGGVAA